MEPVTYLLEIATSDWLTTRAAVEGGADRIELCANLSEGGTTPSYGHIRQCREAFSLPIYPIIRPRGGDFLYTDEEFSIMERDVLLAKQLGCDGIVTGLLLADGSVDRDRTARLVETAYPLGVTFHRAFDRCRDPQAALEELIMLGCERILTSGQQATAPAGAALIAALQQQAAGRIVIMPGSGVRAENIRELVRLTGCTEYHSSLRTKTKSRMAFIHPAFAGDEESYMNNAVDPVEVRQLAQALRS
ncbi:MAG TPA: copper homeostasis protein CutC [Chitinophagaceae bacterium]|nr:copper homeostasis protein CutC [Chitinophagaceae bacterium]